MNTKRIQVAAAAIEGDGGRILLSKRAAHLHQGGLWEFPGGKLEPGEPPLQGLAREMREELGIVPVRTEPLIRINHTYPDRQVMLDVYRVSQFIGVPQGLEGQPLRWCLPGEMDPQQFPAADRPVIQALQMPDQCLITGVNAFDPGLFLKRLHRSLEKDLRLVLLRAHDLPDAAYRSLAEQALVVCRDFGARLLLSRPANILAWAGMADGIHLTRHQLMAYERRPLAKGWTGGSCHNPAELSQAILLGLDYAFLSPVEKTTSHPLSEPLGWERFAAWVEPLNLPVYALGGVGPADLEKAKRHGAQGVAAISQFWSD